MKQGKKLLICTTTKTSLPNKVLPLCLVTPRPSAARVLLCLIQIYKMAIWQFHIDFIPASGAIRVLSGVPKMLPSRFKSRFLSFWQSLNSYEDPTKAFWTGHFAGHITEELDNRLPIVEWLKDAEGINSWGSPETNDVRLAFEPVTKEIKSFSCRIDLRDIDDDFIDLLLGIATQKELLIVGPKGNIIQPNRLELGKLMSNSKAANFVADSDKFIADFIEGKGKPE